MPHGVAQMTGLMRLTGLSISEAAGRAGHSTWGGDRKLSSDISAGAG